MLGFIVKLFVLVRKVSDVWEWLNCVHVDTSEGGPVMSRCAFRSVHYLEVKICCKNALGPRIVSAVRSLEVVASRRLPMYLQVWDFQSVTRALSALGSVSASRSGRSGRFYCICSLVPGMSTRLHSILQYTVVY